MDLQRLASSLVISFAVLTLLLGAAAPVQAKTVTLDHETLTITPAGAIGLYPDEVLEIVITNTSRRCYTFNLTPVEEEEGARLESADVHRDTVSIPVVHDAGVVAYEVVVRKKPNLPAGLENRCDRQDHTFRVPVKTYEWRLGGAGAFTGDRLTDSVFYLEDGVENPDAPPEMQRQGFFVRQSMDAEDSYSLGAAAMVHLFHNDPVRFDFKKRKESMPSGTPGAGLVHWAPVSFGLGVGEESNTRYYLGTSLRFGQKAFLTAGWVFGSRDRLPDGLDVGGFTTEANALGSLGSKTSSAVFIGLSFDFLNVGASSFMGPFQTAKPEPPGEETTPQEEAAPQAEGEGALEQLREALNETGDEDPFKDDAIFEADFEGDRFCAVTPTEDPLGVTVEVNLESLVDPRVVKQPDASEELTAKNERIKAVVAERAADHLEGAEAEDLDITLATCFKP